MADDIEDDTVDRYWMVREVIEVLKTDDYMLMEAIRTAFLLGVAEVENQVALDDLIKAFRENLKKDTKKSVH